MVGALELVPPVGQCQVNFAAPRAQHQEVVAGAEARQFDEAEGMAPGAFFEARLQGPDVIDVAGDAARDGELLPLHVEDLVHGFEQRRNRDLAARLARLPVGQNLVPQQGGEQVAG